jgi:hypothetical protein
MIEKYSDSNYFYLETLPEGNKNPTRSLIRSHSSDQGCRKLCREAIHTIQSGDQDNLRQFKGFYEDLRVRGARLKNRLIDELFKCYSFEDGKVRVKKSIARTELEVKIIALCTALLAEEVY